MELVKAEDNQQAFRILVERYKGKAMSYLAAYKLERAIREDLVQEAFLKIFRSRNQYKDGSKFSSWYWTILKNTTLDYLRKHKESLYNDFKNEFEDGESYEGQIPGDELTPEERLIEISTAEQIRKCFDGLKSKEREILKTRLYFELSYGELANKFESSISVIKNTIFRAKKALADCLKECVDG